MIFLPGTDKQLKFLLENVNPEGRRILIAGSQGDKLSAELIKIKPAALQVITDDSSELTDMRYKLKGSNIPVKLMDYRNTDFNDATFDVIYAQGTFSTSARRKIYKEALRILKPDGIICTGEVISIEKKVPPFMQNIWETSGISPLTPDEQLRFFNETGLEITAQKNLSSTLEEFYRTVRKMLAGYLQEGTEEEKRYYKKLINRFSHEANAYLDLGGAKYMDFTAFILQRKK